MSIIGDLLKSRTQKKAASRATEAQLESTSEAIGESRRQFDLFQELLSPFASAGTDALSGLLDIVGLGDSESARDSIIDIEASPEFGARTRLGEEAILANASATGGLRGGDTEGALAQFRPQVLSDLINQRFQRLSGITQLGQSSAAGVGAAGLQTGRNVSNLLLEQGAIRGEGALARGNINSQLFGNIEGNIGNALGFGVGGGF